MTNKIREMIEKLEADENRAEGSEKLIQMLKEKEFELGENIPEEVKKIIKGNGTMGLLLANILRRKAAHVVIDSAK